MFPTNSIKLPIDAISPLLVNKLREYVDMFDLMDEHDGWFPYPDSVLSYFNELGVVHWAELYFPEGLSKWAKDKEPQIIQFAQAFADATGNDPSIETVNGFLVELAKEFSQSDATILGLEFLDTVPNTDLVRNISDVERHHQRDVFIGFLVGFYNDLSIAAHGESIFTLVTKARENYDDDALAKAVQIDPTILKYFEKVLMNRSMKGNSNFFDSLSYRIKNSPRKGVNKHPLLWILMKDLVTLSCLRRDVTSKQILNIYSKAVGDHSKFVIDDELTVQRQRRKFMKVYRHVK